jgi:drug/metabolite transporter (DMT)-like permease
MVSEKDYSYPFALFIALIGGSFVIIQKYLLNHGINWKAMMTVNSLYFFIFGIIFTYYYRNDIVPEVKRFNWKIFALLGISILLATFVSSILNYKLLERNDAYIVSGLTLVAPIFTLIFAKLFLDEDINCKGVLGILIIIVGSWIIIQAKQEADAKKTKF